MTYDNLINETDLSKVELSQVYSGVVINTATATTDEVYVAMEQTDADDEQDLTPIPARVGPVHWSARGADYPKRGDTALVAFSDIGEGWLVEWVPSTPTPVGGGGTSSPATPTALGIVELTTAATDPTHPKVVTDEDPRNTNARTPTAHTHPESDVTNLVSDLAARVQIGGDLGGTPTVPTVPALANKEDKANKGVASGYAPLDASSLLPTANLPNVPTAKLPDATGAAKGVIQLAGDISGTAASPTVPALANKENTSNKGVANGYAPLDSGLLVPAANIRTLDAIRAPAADVSLALHKLTNVLDPTVAQDAATKHYVDNLGVVTQLPTIGARAYLTGGTQSITAGLTSGILLPSEDYDTDTIHDTTTNTSRMVINTAGAYQVSGDLQWNVGTGGFTYLTIYKNGSAIPGVTSGNDKEGARMNVSALVNCVVGDFLELVVNNATSATLTASAASFSVVRVPGASSVLVGPQAPAIGARARATAAVSIPNGAWTAVALNDELFDTDTIHDTVTNNTRLTCRTAGVYQITGNLQYGAASTGHRGIGIKLNGATTLTQDLRNAISTFGDALEIATAYSMSPGDYVELVTYQDSGAAQNLDVSTANNPPTLAMIRIPGAQGSALGVTSALPSNPVDGQECYFLADATNGVVWHLKYRAASASAYKWEYIGGADLRDFVVTQQPRTSSVYGDLTTIGPSVTVPLAGDYDVQVGGGLQAPNNTGSIAVVRMSFAVGATAPLDADGAYNVCFWSSGGQAQEGSCVGPVARKAGLTANTLLQAKYNTSAGSANFANRWITARPVRVG